MAMDWKRLIAELSSRGWTQSEIAKRVNASQPAISDLASGRTRMPAYDIGAALIGFHAGGESKQASTAAEVAA